MQVCRNSIEYRSLNTSMENSETRQAVSDRSPTDRACRAARSVIGPQFWVAGGKIIVSASTAPRADSTERSMVARMNTPDALLVLVEEIGRGNWL